MATAPLIPAHFPVLEFGPVVLKNVAFCFVVFFVFCFVRSSVVKGVTFSFFCSSHRIWGPALHQTSGLRGHPEINTLRFEMERGT